MIGEFRLNMSEVIQVLVGQEGGSNINAWGSGGGGGTFVVRGNSTPMIIAGGGGGGGPRAKYGYGSCNANTGTTGMHGQGEAMELVSTRLLVCTQVRVKFVSP